MATCSTEGCGKTIDWAKTYPGNKPMPIDRDSAGKEGGNLAVWREGRNLRCRVLRAGESPRADEKWGTNHWGTCTKPDEHRDGGIRDDLNARPAGWYHAKRHRRWEYRSVDGGAVLDWYHDLKIADDPGEVMESIARMGIPPLPPEARPAPSAAAPRAEPRLPIQ